MKKNSFLTSGPIVAMVVWFAGTQPASESSWYPLSRSWTVKMNRAIPVTLKNRPRSILTLPRMNSTPNQTARTMPTIEPTAVITPLVVSDTAARKSAVSTPSRTTIRKVNRKMPPKTAGELERETIRPSVPRISPDTERAWRHIQTTMVETMTAEAT